MEIKMKADQVEKRIKISLPQSSYELIRAMAEKRGLSVRGYVASRVFDAALEDRRRELLALPAKRVFTLLPESAEAFAKAWDNPPEDNEAMKEARRLAAKIKFIEPNPEDEY